MAKYIVTKQKNGTEEIFTFPESVNHKEMAMSISHIKAINFDGGGKWAWIEREPISAGFVVNKECVGMSESLGLRSRECDTKMLIN